MTLSVKEIKKRLTEGGIDFEGIFEKADLVALLPQGSTRLIPRSSGSTPTTIAMSVSSLREIIRSLAGRTSQCTEKTDLYRMARDLLVGKTCIVCMDTLLASPSETVVRLPCCPSFWHKHCLAEWLLRSAQEGRFPHNCPSCKHQIPDSFISKHVITDDSGWYLRYVSAVEGLRRLRAAAAQHQDGHDLSSMGFKRCPQCGSWIEKGPSMEAFGVPVMEGCDKMTCRCGCQFCFRCGSLGAACRCTGRDHGFFSHQEVLADYPRSNVGASGLLSSLF